MRENPQITRRHEVPPGAYRIDPAATTVRFTTRAVFGLLPVRGSFTVDHGRILIAEEIEDSAVDAVIGAASFESGNQQRDAHVRSPDYLDAAEHPEITFRGQDVGRSAEGVVGVRGALTVRGVTRPAALTLAPVIADDRRLRVRATTRIDRYAFGLTGAKGMTGRHLDITLDVVAFPIGT